MATTYYVVINYENNRPSVATVTGAYEIYTSLGGTLQPKEFAEKVKEYDGVSLGHEYEQGYPAVTFLADILTKQANPEFKNVSTLIDLNKITTDETEND